MSRIILEVGVEDSAGIDAAIRGGADRILLCSALSIGGVTPSPGLIRLAAMAGYPTMVNIRPRPGDFVWSPLEVLAMRAEIAAVRGAGLKGVVLGATLPDGSLDEDILTVLVRAASGMNISLNRCIDLSPDPQKAMAICAKLGIRGVLSSGGAQTAAQGLDRLKRMQDIPNGVTLIPCGGITPENVEALVREISLTEVHISCSAPNPDNSHPLLDELGLRAQGLGCVDAATVRAFRGVLDAMSNITLGNKAGVAAHAHVSAAAPPQ